MLKKLFLLFFLSLTACIPTHQLYHDKYGFEGNNPPMLNSDKTECYAESYEKYPLKNFKFPKAYEPNSDEDSTYGEVRYERTAMDQSAEAREITLKRMKEYDDARQSCFDLCLSNKGWRLVQITE